MPASIFVNLPVKDLERSKRFFAALGYRFNPQFTDDKAACLMIDDRIFAMLLTEPFFGSFTPKPVADAAKSTEVLVSLSLDSADAVRALVARAKAAGARILRDPADHGFMFQWGFEDPDGHIWEYFWMDPAHVQPPPPEDLVLERVLAAPPPRVFDAWTQPRDLVRWFGPRGVAMPLCELEPRPGGRVRFVHELPGGERVRVDGAFVEVERPLRLSFDTHFADAQWRPAAHFMVPDMPLDAHLVTTATLASDGAGTRLTVRQTVLPAEAARHPAVQKERALAKDGWRETLDRLAALVAEE